MVKIEFSFFFYYLLLFICADRLIFVRKMLDSSRGGSRSSIVCDLTKKLKKKKERKFGYECIETDSFTLFIGYPKIFARDSCADFVYKYCMCNFMVV